MNNQINEFLIEHLNKQYGNTLTEEILNGYKEERFTTIRINTLKTTKELVINEFNSLGISFEELELFPDALVILNRNSKEMLETKLCAEGKIYLQSLSSQLPALLLDTHPNQDVLDMCASPGSKTTYIAQLTNDTARITACEIDKIRCERLKYNINKLGINNVTCMCVDATKLDDYFRFDNILLDAPCSGSGTLSIHDKSFSKFSKALVYNSSKLQMLLLKKALTILKPGKTMIYSTCSILNIENEEVINKVLKSFKCSIVKFDSSITNKLPLLPTSIDGGLCIKPNKYFEGFYVIKIKKEA